MILADRCRPLAIAQLQFAQWFRLGQRLHYWQSLQAKALTLGHSREQSNKFNRTASTARRGHPTAEQPPAGLMP
jgi:hypothetical protein